MSVQRKEDQELSVKDFKPNTVCVVGLGYVGLPTAVLIAQAGHSVFGVDISAAVLESLRAGNAHVKEPGVNEILRSVLASDNFKPTEKPVPADIYIIAVPTPIHEDKRADLKPLVSALESILPVIQEGNLVVVESTINPGCIEDCVLPILSRADFASTHQVDVAYCPERVLPGHALREIVHNERTIGGYSSQAAQRAQKFYATFTQSTIHVTGHREAEMVKLTENAFRDVNIAFANELANICERLGVDVREVIRLANRHPRVQVLDPGPGVGGHCIAVDPWFIIEKCPDESPLLTAARHVNDGRPHKVADTVMKLIAGVDHPVVAALGITYKANVCDVRESPAIEVVEILRDKGIDVRVCDPIADTKSPYPNHSLEDVVKGADVALLLVEHEPFRNADVELLKASMRHPQIVDTRGVWREKLAHNGRAALATEMAPAVAQ